MKTGFICSQGNPGDSAASCRRGRTYGFVIGWYSSLIGVGGGAVSNLVLTLYGCSIHTAVGISAGVGIWISTAGTIAYALAGLSHQAEMPPLSLGFVSFLGVALMRRSPR